MVTKDTCFKMSIPRHIHDDYSCIKQNAPVFAGGKYDSISYCFIEINWNINFFIKNKKNPVLIDSVKFFLKSISKNPYNRSAFQKPPNKSCFRLDGSPDITIKQAAKMCSDFNSCRWQPILSGVSQGGRFGGRGAEGNYRLHQFRSRTIILFPRFSHRR